MVAWASVKDGRLRFALKVTPGAKRHQVKAPKVNADGKGLLRVSVTAAPEEGKANAAVIKLLAKRWKVAAGRFSLASGATARQKVIEIAEGDQALLQEILVLEESGI